MKEVGVVIVHFVIAILCSGLIISVIERAIASEGFKLTDTSKYIISVIIILLSGILCGQVIVLIS